MYIAYDYSEFITELNYDLGEGFLKETDNIQLLRGDRVICGEVRAVVDWYYDKEYMSTLPLTDDHRQQYLTDLPKLETVTVKEALSEFGKWSLGLGVYVGE